MVLEPFVQLVALASIIARRMAQPTSDEWWTTRRIYLRGRASMNPGEVSGSFIHPTIARRVELASDLLNGFGTKERGKMGCILTSHICCEADMLDIERQYFEDHRAEWLEKFPGKVVLVKGDRLVGTFDTLDDALSAGARHYGLDSFLVRHVEEAEAEILIPALTLGLLGANS
jgi:hypothetical protein